MYKHPQLPHRAECGAGRVCVRGGGPEVTVTAGRASETGRIDVDDAALSTDGTCEKCGGGERVSTDAVADSFCAIQAERVVSGS